MKDSYMVRTKILEQERKILKDTIESINEKYDAKIKELSLIRRISDSLVHALDMKKVCKMLIRTVIDESTAENCSLMLYDKRSRKLVLRAAKGQMDKRVKYYDKPDGISFKLGVGIAGLVAKTKKTILIPDVDQDPRFINHKYNAENIGSIICLPLLFKGKISGVFNLSHPEKNAFSKEDERILTIIANQAAIVLSNVSAVEELQISNEKLKEALDKLKAAEKELENYSKNLEKMVEEKTIELRESEEQYKNLFEDANAGIITLDLDHQITSVNRKFEKLVERNRKDLIGKNIHDIFEVIDEEQYQDTFKNLLNDKDPLSYEVKIQTPKGTRILDVNSSYIYYKDELEGIQQIYRDVTEKKFYQDQLLQTEKLASLGELMSGVAHELNNPLSIIFGFSELLYKEKGLEPNILRKVEKIFDASLRGKKIIENLLRFAREKQLEFSKIDVNKIIDDTIEIRDYDLKVNNIRVIKNFKKELPLIYGDPNQLQQILLNLINNSYDAIREAGKKGKIEIKTHVKNNAILIEITDDGPGIPEKIQDKIFDPFFTTKETGRGTGLGLSLSYGLIKDHGGTIYLDKAYTDGAKFVISLPVKKDFEETTSELTKSYDNITKKAKILVIDDEEYILDLSREILEKENHLVDVAQSGKEAKKLIEKNDYDLIISDIKMPGEIGGVELFYIVSSMKPELKDKIIFITGDKVSQDTCKFLAEQKNIHIDKPFSIDTYLNAVKKILSKE